jgi:hypothetical protein
VNREQNRKKIQFFESYIPKRGALPLHMKFFLCHKLWWFVTIHGQNVLGNAVLIIIKKIRGGKPVFLLGGVDKTLMKGNK